MCHKKMEISRPHTRFKDDRLTKRIIDWYPRNYKRRKERQKPRWSNDIKKVVQDTEI